MTVTNPPFRTNGLGSSLHTMNQSSRQSESSLHPQDDFAAAKMQAFRKVKPTCVQLMGLATQPPTPHSRHAQFLADLSSQLRPLPQTAFTPSFINYLLFPLTQILRQSDPSTLPERFLEEAFTLLDEIVGRWRLIDGGMEINAWSELWRFVVGALGLGRGGTKGKGKARDVGQEVQYQAVLLLKRLLEPSVSNDQVQHPSPAMLKLVETTTSPLLPTLFQTLTFLLDTISPSPPHLQLQLVSLRLARSIITTYLRGKHSILASVLPGVVSGVAKLISEGGGKGLKGDVCVECGGLVGDVIVGTLNDVGLRDIGVLRPVLDDLTQLSEEWDNAEEPLPPKHPVPPSPAPSTTSTVADPFPPLSSSYLAFTSSQLLTSIPPILLTLSSHTSHLSRQAAVTLSHELLSSCSASLPQLIPHTLSTLLLLSTDDFDPVRHEARRRLRTLLESPNQLDDTLIEILSTAMNALPRLIASNQDIKVGEMARIITAIAQTTSDAPGRRKNVISDLLGPSGHVERWSWGLLGCLEFGRPSDWRASGVSQNNRGWEGRMLSSGLSGLLEGTEPTDQEMEAFPVLPLKYVESAATIRLIKSMLFAMGIAGGETALHSVEHFIHFAKSHQQSQIARSVSAVWVGEKLLKGILKGQEEGMEGKVSRGVRKMAREIIRIVISMDEVDEDEIMPDASKEESDALLPVERTTGMNTLTTLLDKPALPNSQRSAQTRKLHIQSQTTLLTCHNLQLLTLTSYILTSSFRPHLLTALYYLLSHLASPQPLISQFASIALHQISHQAGYASTRSLLLQNTDYIINTVSQHLHPTRLSPIAPLVLISMIKLVGNEIVPQVHDIVDEIFDALDDYHGYESLSISLLGVLGTLVGVMKVEVDIIGVSAERLEKLKEMRRVGDAPDPERDFDRFINWYKERGNQRQKDMDDILQRAPQHAWGKAKDTSAPDPSEGEEQPQQPPPPDEGEKPATRVQEICTSILEKSLPFLSHPSPFLRSKILSLIAQAIPVLAAGNRESDLLPLIDKSWNIILNRLDDKYPYVITEAAEVIAVLCAEAGDFMSRRIMDTAWPRLIRIMEGRWKEDKMSALGKKGKGVVGTETRFSVSHRLYVAVLGIGVYVAKEVPVNDGVLWDMGVRFRVFLDERVDGELQVLGRGLYAELGKRDGDAMWMLLKASLGDMEGKNGVWSYLREEGTSLAKNASLLLEDL